MARVLIVDDDPAIQEVFGRMLRRRAHVVHEALTQEQALTELQSFNPDVILLDVVLPDGNGLSLLPDFSKQAPDAPVIVLTASSDQRHARAALRGGAYDYLIKSEASSFISEAISRALEHGGLKRERRRLAEENAHQKRELASLVSRRTRELHATRDSLDDLLDNASELVQSTDLDGRYRYVNRFWLETLGYAREEIPKLTLWDVVEPACHASCRNIHQRLLEGSRRERLETTLLAKSGRSVEVEGSANLRRDEGGTLVRAILLDVTERNRGARAEKEARRHAELRLLEEKGRLASEVEAQSTQLDNAYQALLGEAEHRERAEHAAKQAAAELDSIFHTAAGAFRVIDADFNVVRVNRTLLQLVGLSESQMVGRKCWESFPGQDCQTEHCSLRRVLAGEVIEDEEVRKVPQRGEELVCLLNARPLLRDGERVEGMLEELRDITEVKRLQLVAEAVSLSENVAYVVSGIRHELGNPVNSIKTTLAVLRSRLDRLDRHGVLEYVERANKDVGQMEFILRSLRSLHMFEALTLTAVRLPDFMSNFQRLVSRDTHPHRFEVRFSTIGNPDDFVVRVDPSALQQVLINLVNNARDALTDREDGLISVGVDRKGALVRLTVEDNGCGMSPDQQKDLFRPFRTGKRNGTGLGLTIVRKVLARMHGTIEIASRKAVGTTATVLLPSCES